MTIDQLILTLIHGRRVPVLVGCGIEGHVILPVIGSLDPLSPPGRGGGSGGGARPFPPIDGSPVWQAVQAPPMGCTPGRDRARRRLWIV